MAKNAKPEGNVAQALGHVVGGLMAKVGNGDRLWPHLEAAAAELRAAGVTVKNPKRSPEFYAERDKQEKSA